MTLENKIKKSFDEKGYYIAKGIFDKNICSELREAFFNNLKYCSKIQKDFKIDTNMKNTVHHVVFMEKIFTELLDKDEYMLPIKLFFDNKKFILNSLGGQNNNGTFNYAANIHRDVRFYTQERLLLNTIWCINGFNELNGPTELFATDTPNPLAPTTPEFEKNITKLICPPGSVIYFDSRIWHRAGKPLKEVKERIIFTPIFSRPYVKPGFNYSKALIKHNPENYSDHIKQLMGYFSDVPETHEEWYNLKERRFYYGDQDI